jgi:hypothetical protein
LETGEGKKLGKEGEKDETEGRGKLSVEEIFSEKNVAVRREKPPKLEGKLSVEEIFSETNVAVKVE